MLRAGEKRKCEACGREFIGAANGTTGDVAPIVLDVPEDVVPVGEEPAMFGNCILFNRGGEIRYAVIGSSSLRVILRDLGVPLRINHFADCPEAARFSK